MCGIAGIFGLDRGLSGDEAGTRRVLERMVEAFRPFREVRSELTPELVNRILEEGSERARDEARHTMVEVRRAVGLPAYVDR